MSSIISIPTNENGIFFDPALPGVVTAAVADEPFQYQDFFVYSHGWATDADQAMTSYSRFSVEFARQLLLLPKARPFADPPKNSLGIGIHWPSEITEDPGSVLNNVELLTFYSMEQRADAVGKNAVYAILRLILATRAAGGTALRTRLVLLGHSFGCKVILAALDALQTDLSNGTIDDAADPEFRVVLLEPATDNDHMEQGDEYGNVPLLPNLRMLITKSSLDAALNTWYLNAGRVVNVFHPKPALGATGPTAASVARFASVQNVAVAPGFDGTAIGPSQLVVADLSPVHQARVTSGAFTGGGWGGSHSDIYFDEVYDLAARFAFG